MALMHKSHLLIALIATLSGCARVPQRPATQVQVAVLPEEGVPSDWRRIATAEDRARLDAIGTTWALARDEAVKSDAAAVIREGDLLRPEAALPAPTPTPGLYQCRSVRLGGPEAPAATSTRRGRTVTRFRTFDCVVAAEQTLLSFTKVTGTHRPGGYLWPDGDRRMVFLGGTVEREGEGASAYGNDPLRNRAGMLERIGEFRWRLTLLGQSPVARLEIIELVPAVAVPVRAAR